jgi:hypothetical protein
MGLRMKPHIQILPEHEQHARELLDALNRIHELQGEIHEAKRPCNWQPMDMLLQLQSLLADGVEILIGSARLMILHGEAHYHVHNAAELQETLDSICNQSQRKVA